MRVNEQEKFLDREKQREQLQAVLSQSGLQKPGFVALEFYGIGGLGKSRVLDEAKRECRELGLPFVVIDFLADRFGPGPPWDQWRGTESKKQSSSSDNVRIVSRSPRG